MRGGTRPHSESADHAAVGARDAVGWSGGLWTWRRPGWALSMVFAFVKGLLMIGGHEA